MNILMLGGTRFAGVHAVRELLSKGHSVTIATRGYQQDPFGNSVARKIIDRKNAESLRAAFAGEAYDVAIDNLAYCSNDVRNLLDVLHVNKYVMTSTVSVYTDFHMDMRESEMNTKATDLKWCDYEDFGYDEVKRQAEAALFQAYSHIPSVAIRFPWIFGSDDYTKRLYFYIEHIINGQPMYADNLESRLHFINSWEAGRFMAFSAESDITGYVNAGSIGTVSLAEIIAYTEKRTGKKAVLREDGEPSPLNGVPDFSLNTDTARDAGFIFRDINEWVYPMIDSWIKG